MNKMTPSKNAEYVPEMPTRKKQNHDRIAVTASHEQKRKDQRNHRLSAIHVLRHTGTLRKNLEVFI